MRWAIPNLGAPSDQSRNSADKSKCDADRWYCDTWQPSSATTASMFTIGSEPDVEDPAPGAGSCADSVISASKKTKGHDETFLTMDLYECSMASQHTVQVLQAAAVGRGGAPTLSKYCRLLQ